MYRRRPRPNDRPFRCVCLSFRRRSRETSRTPGLRNRALRLCGLVLEKQKVFSSQPPCLIPGGVSTPPEVWQLVPTTPPLPVPSTPPRPTPDGLTTPPEVLRPPLLLISWGSERGRVEGASSLHGRGVGNSRSPMHPSKSERHIPTHCRSPSKIFLAQCRSTCLWM